MKCMALVAIAVRCTRPDSLNLDVVEVELPEGKLTNTVVTEIANILFKNAIKSATDPLKFDIKFTDETRAQVTYFYNNFCVYDILVYAFHIQQLHIQPVDGKIVC